MSARQWTPYELEIGTDYLGDEKAEDDEWLQYDIDQLRRKFSGWAAPT